MADYERKLQTCGCRILTDLCSASFAETHIHKQTQTFNLRELKRSVGVGAPAESGNMSPQTITFLTTKFNYSLSSLWSSLLPLIEAFTRELSKMSLQRVVLGIFSNPCPMGAAKRKYTIFKPAAIMLKSLTVINRVEVCFKFGLLY